jgi:hypothetical protein
MQPDSQGGDGAASVITGQEHNLPPIQGEVSSTPEELAAKIDAELGIPHVPAPAAEEPVEPVAPETPPETPPEEPVEPAGEEDPTPPEEPEAPVEEPKAATAPTDEELFIQVEDAEGVTHKISKIEDLPEDFEPKSNRQIIEIVAQLAKLDAKAETLAAEQAEVEARAAENERQQQQFDAWDREIKSLGKDRIDPKDQTRIDAVFDHMIAINKARAEAGNPNRLQSFEDALDKFEAQEIKNAEADKAKAENARAKAKASVIGGTSAPSTGDAQPYRSGSYRSIDDIPISV